MKIQTPSKSIVLLLCSLLLVITSMGCSKQEQEAPTNSTTEIPAAYTAELNYYKSVLAKLEDELIKTKEEKFISEAELRSQIASLEQQLSSIKSEKPTLQMPPLKDDTPNVNGITLVTSSSDFTAQSNGEGFTILSYAGTDSSITIPSSISGTAVTKIADSAFKNTNIKEITISEGITELGWFVFENASSLARVSLPASLTSIGYGTFDGCPPSMVIVCPHGSYAEAYAQSWGLNYINE